MVTASWNLAKAPSWSPAFARATRLVVDLPRLHGRAPVALEVGERRRGLRLVAELAVGLPPAAQGGLVGGAEGHRPLGSLDRLLVVLLTEVGHAQPRPRRAQLRVVLHGLFELRLRHRILLGLDRGDGGVVGDDRRLRARGRHEVNDRRLSRMHHEVIALRALQAPGLIGLEGLVSGFLESIVVGHVDGLEVDDEHTFLVCGPDLVELRDLGRGRGHGDALDRGALRVDDPADEPALPCRGDEPGDRHDQDEEPHDRALRLRHRRASLRARARLLPAPPARHAELHAGAPRRPLPADWSRSPV